MLSLSNGAKSGGWILGVSGLHDTYRRFFVVVGVFNKARVDCTGFSFLLIGLLLSGEGGGKGAGFLKYNFIGFFFFFFYAQDLA